MILADERTIKELTNLQKVSGCSNSDIHLYLRKAEIIALETERTTVEILSEINYFLTKSTVLGINEIIKFIGNKTKNKTEDNYMKHFGGSLKDFDLLQTGYFNKTTIKDVIYSDPATIVLWRDGSKTVVKCQEGTGDTYNPELGLAMCIIKKCCGNKGNYNDVFNKWLPKEE